MILINEAMASYYWPDADPLGSHIVLRDVPDAQPREIVGIVGDVLLRPAWPSSVPTMYVPLRQQPPVSPAHNWRDRAMTTFLVRAEGDPMNLMAPARAVVADIDPGRPATHVLTLAQIVDNRFPAERFYAGLLGTFAGVASALALLGLYGVMAWGVAERRREIGLRMALGATRLRVLRLILRQTMLIAGAGLIAGLAGALALTRLLDSLLWGVTPTDPAIFATVAAALLCAALMTCLLAARRAVALGPTVTLREHG